MRFVKTVPSSPRSSALILAGRTFRFVRRRMLFLVALGFGAPVRTSVSVIALRCDMVGWLWSHVGSLTRCSRWRVIRSATLIRRAALWAHLSVRLIRLWFGMKGSSLMLLRVPPR